MTTKPNPDSAHLEDAGLAMATRWAGAFLASCSSPQTRRAYRRDLHCWFDFCARHHLHPYTPASAVPTSSCTCAPWRAGTRPPPRRLSTVASTRSARGTGGSRTKTSSSATPAARVRRPHRHVAAQPWLIRNELTDLLGAAEDEKGPAHALACLLGLNGLRVSEACSAQICDIGGARYAPTLRIIGKGDKPADIALNPRTQQAVDLAIGDRRHGPILLNQRGAGMRPHNASAVIRRLARTARIPRRVTPHALRRSYITVGLLQGVPLRDMQRAARHAKADTTIGYDQSDQSFHRDPTFVLMSATAR